MKKQKISDAVIHRLPRYYRYLDDLYNKGVVRISSSSLGDKMDITASQIRQDLSCFGEFGQQGYGYNVAELRAEIGHILGIDNGHRLIIIGVGHLGHALLQNFDFEKVGFQVDSAFDVSPALVDTQIRGVTIRPMDQLAEYVARYRPNVAVLTVPQNVAQPLADQLIDLGIRGFWNFTNNPSQYDPLRSDWTRDPRRLWSSFCSNRGGNGSVWSSSAYPPKRTHRCRI